MRSLRDTDMRHRQGSERESGSAYSGAQDHSVVRRGGRGKYEDNRYSYSSARRPKEYHSNYRDGADRTVPKRGREGPEDGEVPAKRHGLERRDEQMGHTSSKLGEPSVVESSLSRAPVSPSSSGDDTPSLGSAELDMEDEEARTQRLLEESKARRAAILSRYQENGTTRTPQPSALPLQPSVEAANVPLHTSIPTASASGNTRVAAASVGMHVGAGNIPSKDMEREATKEKGAPDDDFCMFADDSDDIFATTPTTVQVANPQRTAAQQVGGGLELRDSEGYLRVRAGDVIGGRYQVRGDVGRGVFANVLICTDLQAKPDAEQGTASGAGAESITAEDKRSIEEAASGTLRLSGRNASTSAVASTPTSGGTAMNSGLPVGTASRVAVKVLRANDTMRRAGIKEMEILRRIAAADPTGRFHCVRLLDSFTHEDHLCLVFEAMAVNLKELQMKYGKGVGISLTAVRTYGTHILLALALLQNLGVVHADIKPHNVLVSENLSYAKLADFGSAFLVDDPEANPTPYLVSRFYRAPEIILGYNHTPALDMWSVATLLFELYTGSLLFPGDDNNDMLYRIQCLRGRFPPKMIRKHIQHCETTGLEPHFDPGTLTFLRHTVDPVTNEPIVREAQFAGPQESLMDRLRQAGGTSEQRRELGNLCDLLLKMLTLDPSKRITVGAALKHPFFTQVPGRSNPSS